MLKKPYQNLFVQDSIYLDQTQIVSEIRSTIKHIGSFKDDSSILDSQTQQEIITSLQTFLRNIIKKVQSSEYLIQDEIEESFMDSSFLSEYPFLIDLVIQIFENITDESKRKTPQINTFAMESLEINQEKKSIIVFPSSDSKEEIDIFIKKHLSSFSIQEFLNKFSIQLDSQKSFEDDFENFDQFSSKLNLFKYLSKRYYRLSSEPRSSMQWYREFISSDRYTESDNIGFDKEIGKGDHGSYYYNSVSITDGTTKKCVFLSRNQDRINSIYTEKILKEVFTKLDKLATLSINLKTVNEPTKSNFYIYMKDLNNIIDVLITNLLGASQIKAHYSI